MATGYVDPVSDVTAEWDNSTEATHYDAIDDGVRQPTTPEEASNINTSTDGDTDEFEMSSISGVDSVSAVKIWAYGYYFAPTACDVDVQIYMGGSWQTEVALSLEGTKGWKSALFEGSWTQSDLDNLKVRLNADVPGNGVEIDAMYGEITYVAGSGGGEGAARLDSEAGIFPKGGAPLGRPGLWP